jgi:hypothetical protein
MASHNRTHRNQTNNILQISAFNRIGRWHKHYGKKEKNYLLSARGAEGEK